MGQHTSIAWTHHTWNPWRGCTKVSTGCQFCYAETLSHRNPAVLGVWGDKATRSIAVESYWHQPFLWDKKARLAGERRRVFCLSLGDIFEGRPELVEPRARIWSTIRQTPNLDWLLLTKRPQNIAGMLPDDWGDGYPNVWLGVSVENQKYADERIPDLLQVPAAVRFLSVEPMLEPIDLEASLPCGYYCDQEVGHVDHCLNGKIHWVICGGESGPHARPFDLAWARSIRDQCQAHSVPYFLKQLGSNCHGYWLDPNGNGDGICYHSDDDGWDLGDKKGGNMNKWPRDLRIDCRQFPSGSTQLQQHSNA